MCDKKYIIEFLIYLSIVILVIIISGGVCMYTFNFKQIIIRII
ncbi:putative membrane protein (plasmid) [Clostridium botulinum]|uniref:Uncharacterized protein n=1 Tax=Clostridium botulinum TaxID=1491 RepID=A0A077K2T5_CLOBO|nr:putative membrane protein [Clostridium botulinum Prevot_594]APR02812.1 putative membrane protein [Clostridium botulinum]BAP25798.1 hypothetical protein [Clostridium botulinum]